MRSGDQKVEEIERKKAKRRKKNGGGEDDDGRAIIDWIGFLTGTESRGDAQRARAPARGL